MKAILMVCILFSFNLYSLEKKTVFFQEGILILKNDLFTEKRNLLEEKDKINEQAKKIAYFHSVPGTEEFAWLGSILARKNLESKKKDLEDKILELEKKEKFLNELKDTSLNEKEKFFNSKLWEHGQAPILGKIAKVSENQIFLDIGSKNFIKVTGEVLNTKFEGSWFYPGEIIYQNLKNDFSFSKVSRF